MKYFGKMILVVTAMLVLVACADNSKDNPNDSNDPGESQTVGDNLNEQNPSTEDESIDNGDSEINGETYWVSGSVVNFRETPSMDGEVISQLTRGTEVMKISQEGDWLYISCGETTGYIHGDYVSDYPPFNPEKGEVSIVVKKSERQLELWQGGTVVAAFPIGLGWAPEGHKQVEGDGKTPEGEYYVCVRNSNSSFYLSLGVSYPNKEDAEAALLDGRIDRATYERIKRAIENGQRPDWNTPLGGAIMIHGHGSASDWTAGCIAVENEVMDMLFDYCALGTKITILP